MARQVVGLSSLISVTCRFTALHFVMGAVRFWRYLSVVHPVANDATTIDTHSSHLDFNEDFPGDSLVAVHVGHLDAVDAFLEVFCQRLDLDFAD